MSKGNHYVKTDSTDDGYTLVSREVPPVSVDDWLLDDCALIIETTDEAMTVWEPTEEWRQPRGD